MGEQAKRFELVDVGSLYNPWREMQEADDGEWVEFDAYAALEAENERLRDGLRRIAEWEMPPSGRTFEDGAPMTYAQAFGSNGERDHIRAVARRALHGGRQP